VGHWIEINPWKAGTFFALGGIFIYVVLTSEAGWVPLLDGANLMFHEAGHMIYGIFGSKVEPWGGTLGQLTMPLVALGVFAFQGNAISMGVAGLWLGENFFNIARYVADARVQNLPLVGGGYHDWNHILGGMNAIHKCESIARNLSAVGWLIIVASFAWVAWVWWYQRQEELRPTRRGGLTSWPPNQRGPL